MEEKEVLELIKRVSEEYGFEEIFKELGIEDDDTKLFIIGVLTGLIQIAKRGDKYFFRLTAPQNLPYHLFKDQYPENLRKALEIKSYLAKKYGGYHARHIIGETMRKLKEIGYFKKEKPILTEEQKKKLLDRLSRLL